jgi:hypothetical protein
MTSPSPLSDHRILRFAKKYAALVSDYLNADHASRQILQTEMDRLLESSKLEIEAEKFRRESHLAADIRSFVRDRKPFDRAVSSLEAEAVRKYYSTPPAATLDALSGEDLISLADLFDGWAQDDRLDQRAMIELLGWADGMRTLAEAVGDDYAPPPWPRDVKVPLLKFLADRAGKASQK